MQLAGRAGRACGGLRRWLNTTAPRLAPGAHSSCEKRPKRDELTHVDSAGKVSMVDVGGKDATHRIARASARVHIGQEAYGLVAANLMKKGDVLSVAQIAGIQGAKLTSQLIPLCHPIALSSVKVKLSLVDGVAVDILAEAKTVGQTGVEMEALTGAAVAGLTVIDMVKAVTKEAKIEHVQIEYKSGGKSGEFQRSGAWGV